MARKKKDPEGESIPAANRRVVLPPRTWRCLERMASLEDEEVSVIAARAIRELLKREGYWDATQPAEEA